MRLSRAPSLIQPQFELKVDVAVRGGFEPPENTPKYVRLRDREVCLPISPPNYFFFFFFLRTPRWTRTINLHFRRVSFFQLNYRRLFESNDRFELSPLVYKTSMPTSNTYRTYCTSGRNRTLNLRFWRPLLYLIELPTCV